MLTAAPAAAAPAAAPAASAPRRKRRVLVLVLDGMRPRSIDPRLTPNLARLASEGVTYTRSRTGFPSETMVGAGELFTGAYPEVSGITGNWMIVPGGDTGGVELKTMGGIRSMQRGYRERALPSTSLFQAAAGAGLTSAVIGKEGPAELAASGGATWAVSTGGAYETRHGRRIGAARGVRPLKELVAAAAGPAPERGDTNDATRSDWLARSAAAIDGRLAPDLLTVWLTDPDITQHKHGLGTAQQRTALQAADRAVGMLLDDMRRRGVLADTDIVVTSDHGFSEHLSSGEVPLAATLKAAGIDVSHVVAAGNQHMVRFRTPPTARDFARLRAAIAASPFAGQVRTVIENPRQAPRGDRRDDQRLTGRDLRQGSTRAADAYVVYERDERGVPGSRRRGGRGPGHVPAKPGDSVAGHGSMGWSDLNNTLVLAGPSIERAALGQQPLRTPNAAGIVDVAPTVLRLLGVEAPAAMHGRVLLESLAPEDGVRRGRVRNVASRRNVATTDVRLGERLVRTQVVTERVGSRSYFVGLRTRDRLHA